MAEEQTLLNKQLHEFLEIYIENKDEIDELEEKVPGIGEAIMMAHIHDGYVDAARTILEEEMKKEGLWEDFEEDDDGDTE